jgi:hypothetical protein
MELNDWVYYFMHGVRYVAEKMTNDRQFIADYLREYTMTKPCQAEVLSFQNPYRVLLFFFFDETKPDFRIRLRRTDWNNTNRLIAIFQVEYRSLKIKHSDLSGVFLKCRYCGHYDILYGINVSRNLCAVYFTHDPRKCKTLIDGFQIGTSRPQDVAEMIFKLSVEQASGYF